MGTSIVINGLVHKRARLAGELVYLLHQVDQRRRELEAIDATLKLFDGAPEPHTIRMIRRFSRNNLFGRNEVSRMMACLLREAPAPMTVPEIALCLLKRKGIPYDPHVADWVGACVARVLRSWRDRGMVRTTGTAWEVVR